MNQPTVQHLLDINKRFYQTFALQFSQTRQRLQPGVTRLLKRLNPQSRLLDLGCGNGEVWRALFQNGFQGQYYGLDFSPEFLEIARSIIPQGASDELQSPAGLPHPQAVFLYADLSSDNWDIAFPEARFDTVLAFAVLHHLPGKALRCQILRKINHLLVPGGHFIHSEWQFLNSRRLRSRLQPWEAAGLSPEQVDPGDYLIDWRHGGFGLRYVHAFEEEELRQMAEETGFSIEEIFSSDGEGGKLGLYQIWAKI